MIKCKNCKHFQPGTSDRKGFGMCQGIKQYDYYEDLEPGVKAILPLPSDRNGQDIYLEPVYDL